MPMNKLQWFERIRNLPGWVIAAITLVTTVVGFVVLFQNKVYLVAVILSILVSLSVWLLCLYASFAKTQPLVPGGKGVYRFERIRPWTLTSIIVIPLLASAALSLSPTREIIAIAVLGTATPTPTFTLTPTPTPTWTSTSTFTPTPTPTGVIVRGGTPYPVTVTPTYTPMSTSSPVTPTPESNIPRVSGGIAYEEYAWLDFPFWPVTVGAQSEVEIAGEYLGRAPWIVIDFKLINPSPDETQIIADAELQVELFEPVDKFTDYELMINSSIVPSFLVPEDCPQSSTPSPPFGPRSYGLPDADHLLGILPPSSLRSTPLRPGTNRPTSFKIPPKDERYYILFISANESGKYEFSVNFSLVATDHSTSTIRLGPYKYTFLDAETALAMPKDHIGPRCP